MGNDTSAQRTLLTQSRIRSFRACPRRHYYAYQLARRPIATGDALSFGTCFHRGLELWWREASLPHRERLQVALAAMRLQASSEQSPLEAAALAAAEALLEGYHVRWLCEDWRTVDVEIQLEADLVNPDTGRPSRTFRLAGKLDGLATRGDDHYIVEHKTTSQDISPGSDYWRRLYLDTQVSHYHALAHANGYEVQGCLYDVVRKPGRRVKSATPEDKRKYRKDGALYAGQREEDESIASYKDRLREAIANEPDKYYQRSIIVRLPDELDHHHKDIWLVAQHMRDAIRLGSHPRNADACIQYSRPCDYFDVCTGVQDIGDDYLFRSTTQHPELEETPGDDQ